MERENEHLWNQFCKLGEMMGDGLHYESDGKWITKEYRMLAKILIKETPEMKEHRLEAKKEKNKRIDEQMASLLEKNTCKCGGKLKQGRSGSKVAYCEICNARYKSGKKRK